MLSCIEGRLKEQSRRALAAAANDAATIIAAMTADTGDVVDVTFKLVIENVESVHELFKLVFVAYLTILDFNNRGIPEAPKIDQNLDVPSKFFL